jgi:hypothetical protein
MVRKQVKTFEKCVENVNSVLKVLLSCGTLFGASTFEKGWRGGLGEVVEHSLNKSGGHRRRTIGA